MEWTGDRTSKFEDCKIEIIQSENRENRLNRLKKKKKTNPEKRT